MDWIWFAVNPSLRARIRGMPPPTLASKPISISRTAASLKSWAPAWARRALLAVTTCFPREIACRMKDRAGSRPPMSSTTIWIEGSSSTSSTRVVNTPSGKGQLFFRPTSRSATLARRTGTPSLCRIRSLFCRRICTVPVPTVPKPRIPTLIASMNPFPVLQNVLDAWARLWGAVLVFDKGKADVLTPFLPKPDSRGNRSLGFSDENLGEFQGTHGLVDLRDLRPHEHGRLGPGDRPADPVEAVDPYCP